MTQAEKIRQMTEAETKNLLPSGYLPQVRSFVSPKGDETQWRSGVASKKYPQLFLNVVKQKTQAPWATGGNF